MGVQYRIAAVSYINTLPFLKGLRTRALSTFIDLILAPPARCADLLQEGSVDISLCPVGAFLKIDDWQVLTDYCIGCEGSVRTVCVYAHQPLEELTHIMLSAESRTSNILVQILDREYWRQGLQFVRPGSNSLPAETTGYLCIGDICFQKEREYPVHIDLGQAWKSHTGLPFAFACWATRKHIPEDLVSQLNEALGSGVDQIEQIEFPQGSDIPLLRTYLKENLNFHFDAQKKMALHLFLEKARNAISVLTL